MSAYDAIRKIPDYAVAVAHEATIKPIRGDAMQTKPIALRRNKYMSIKKVGDIVQCLYGGTPYVTFEPDGTIIIKSCGYPSARSFVNAITGANIQAYHGNDWLKCYYDVNGERRLGHMRLDRIQINRFTRTLGGDLFFVNPILPAIHTIDRAKSSKAIAPYKPFLKYANGMIKIREGKFTREDINTTPDISLVPALALSADHLDWDAALMALVRDTKRFWHYIFHTKVTVSVIRSKLIAMVHAQYQKDHGDLLNEKVVTDGSVVRDGNYALYLAGLHRK